MFGYVTANFDELTGEMKNRYRAVYCGICRQIGLRSSNPARLVLSYDTAFLALLLMSLYEPEEQSGSQRCMSHPFRAHPWVDGPYIAYAADMNVALAYHNCLDDWRDDGAYSKKLMARSLQPHYQIIRKIYPRQCQAMEDCMEALRQMERGGETNPDLPATCFGQLMAELFVYTEDLWSESLRQMGLALGRFIYLADAAADFDSDFKKGAYNPFIASGAKEIPGNLEEILVLAMGRCCQSFEKLPLVQDKKLLDNILYSGVWVHRKPEDRRDDNGG